MSSKKKPSSNQISQEERDLTIADIEASHEALWPQCTAIMKIITSEGPYHLSLARKLNALPVACAIPGLSRTESERALALAVFGAIRLDIAVKRGNLHDDPIAFAVADMTGNDMPRGGEDEACGVKYLVMDGAGIRFRTDVLKDAVSFLTQSGLSHDCLYRCVPEACTPNNG